MTGEMATNWRSVPKSNSAGKNLRPQTTFEPTPRSFFFFLLLSACFSFFKSVELRTFLQFRTLSFGLGVWPARAANFSLPRRGVFKTNTY